MHVRSGRRQIKAYWFVVIAHGDQNVVVYFQLWFLLLSPSRSVIRCGFASTRGAWSANQFGDIKRLPSSQHKVDRSSKLSR